MKKSASAGFNNLIGVHTKALEENSKSLVEILEILSEKKLTKNDIAELKEIKKEIKGIDKRIDKLGKYSDTEEKYDYGI